jgi:hypothetical protein
MAKKKINAAVKFPVGARVNVHSGAWGGDNKGEVVALVDEAREPSRLVKLDGEPGGDPRQFTVAALSAA